MKKLFFIAACVAVVFTSCTNKSAKPFDVRDVDSVTVKDGAKNKIKIPIMFLLDSTANDIFKSQEELDEFFSDIVFELQLECNNPRTFIPERVYNIEFNDTIIYHGEKIYKLKPLVQGVAKNAFGVEGNVSDVLDLIAWRDCIHFEAADGEPAEDVADWNIFKNHELYWERMKEIIDKRAKPKQ